MNTHALFIVLICAGVTLVLRALPFVCFGGKNGVPHWLSALGGMLPPAIMAALVVYCLKGVPYGTFADGAFQIIAAVVVIAVHLFKRNTLLSIAAGTAVYMLLVRL